MSDKKIDVGDWVKFTSSLADTGASLIGKVVEIDVTGDDAVYVIHTDSDEEYQVDESCIVSLTTKPFIPTARSLRRRAIAALSGQSGLSDDGKRAQVAKARDMLTQALDLMDAGTVLGEVVPDVPALSTAKEATS